MADDITEPVTGGRWTTYGRSHRVGRTYPGGYWNLACDRHEPRVAIGPHSGSDIRPSRTGDLMCRQDGCAEIPEEG